MSPRPVLLYPDPALKQVAAPVQASELDGVVAELLAAMRSYERCVGIAAPQLGLGVRVTWWTCPSTPRPRLRADDVFRRRSYAESPSSAGSPGGGEAGASLKDSPGGRIG